METVEKWALLGGGRVVSAAVALRLPPSRNGAFSRQNGAPASTGLKFRIPASVGAL